MEPHGCCGSDERQVRGHRQRWDLPLRSQQDSTFCVLQKSAQYWSNLQLWQRKIAECHRGVHSSKGCWDILLIPWIYSVNPRPLVDQIICAFPIPAIWPHHASLSYLWQRELELSSLCIPAPAAVTSRHIHPQLQITPLWPPDISTHGSNFHPFQRCGFSTCPPMAATRQADHNMLCVLKISIFPVFLQAALIFIGKYCIIRYSCNRSAFWEFI